VTSGARRRMASNVAGSIVKPKRAAKRTKSAQISPTEALLHTKKR